VLGDETRAAGSHGGGTVTVAVLFFAGAREAAGVARASRALERGATVSELADQLCSEYGAGLEAQMETCAVWVNGSPARAGTVLGDGDEVALLPPVSGG